MAIRSPIISVLGHVDHGKSSVLDAVRGTNIVRGEAGAITQAIGASIMPINVIRKKCGPIIDSLKMNITIPGILFIDTPGHAAFTSLRKRGGNLADIAIVVVDINEGLKPQTLEAIEILRAFKTPFVIAANKVDLFQGFRRVDDSFLKSFTSQRDDLKTVIETKIYELIGELHEKFSLSAERFDRVDDYTKQVAIIPCSAKDNIGLNELLMVITGLAQKFLEQNLKLDISGPAKGIVLEVKEDKGLGLCADSIIYDGSLKAGDNILIGTMGEPLKAKVRALLLPDALADMRYKKSKFKSVKQVVAATGVKISSPDFTGDVVAGMPILGLRDQDEGSVRASLKKQVDDVAFDADRKGLIVKADTLGSLEALIKLLKGQGINIRRASIGNITKKDTLDAESSFEDDPLNSAILGFNIKEEPSTDKVKIIVRDIIYSLLDDYKLWSDKVKADIEAKELENIQRPAKIEVLQNCIFRQCNPCIAGVEVIEGHLKKGTFIMDKKGDRVDVVKSMQSENKNISEAEKGRQVAASFPNISAAKCLVEGEIYYTDLSQEDFKKLKGLKKHLTKLELEVLKDIAELKRKQNPVWGV